MSVTCLSCSLANWAKTKDGRMHPSGAGECMWVLQEDLPPPKYWAFRPFIGGGYINRKEVAFKCQFIQPLEATKDE